MNRPLLKLAKLHTKVQDVLQYQLIYNFQPHTLVHNFDIQPRILAIEYPVIVRLNTQYTWCMIFIQRILYTKYLLRLKPCFFYVLLSVGCLFLLILRGQRKEMETIHNSMQPKHSISLYPINSFRKA